MEDKKLKDKISVEDKQKVLDKCNEAVSWIDANQVRQAEVFVNSACFVEPRRSMESSGNIVRR